MGTLNDARKDLGFCLRHRRLAEWPHAVRIRWLQRRARLAGFRDGWAHHRAGPVQGQPPLWARWIAPNLNQPGA
jgi:rhamnosyltransferase